MASGGMNIALEKELISNLTQWFEREGGVLKYVEPSITKEHGFKLVATEGINGGEPVISVPLKVY